MQYCEFKGPAIVMEEGRVDDENWGQKIEDYEVSWLFFDIYRQLAKPDDEADWPHSTR